MRRPRSLIAALLAVTLLIPAATAGAAADPLSGWERSRLAPGVELYQGVIAGRPGADAWTVTVRQGGGHLGGQAETDALLARLRAAGFEPEAQQVRWPDGSDRTGVIGSRVRVGRFGGQNQAENQRTALTKAGFDAITEWTGADATPGTGIAQVKVAVIDPRQFRGSLGGSYGTAVAGRETVTAMAQGSLLAVNAGFFVMEPVDGVPGAAAGIAAYRGKLQSAATNGRIAAILRGNGLRPEFAHLRTRSTVKAGADTETIDGINRTPGVVRNCGGVGGDKPTERPQHDVTCTDPDEIVRYTAELGAPTSAGPGTEVTLDATGTVLAVRDRGGDVPAGGSALAGIGAGATWLRDHAVPGQRLVVEDRILDERDREIRLGAEDDIVNGGPELVRDGRVAIDFAADGIERIGDPSFAYTWGIKRNPRMVLGVDRAGRLLLVTTAGRQPGYSDGLGLGEVAKLVQSLGAVRAMNLDGGGSVGMAVNGKMITMPSDATGERAVGDALLLRR
ncbi:phosphodiester glycosidase family protein [Pseudonocardiaceae bacterium YIM PH 21723]|nr:phosphodiester glycosidase family protein [Pseudonocardiaceae bacterium YIM PH 21723]